jgi:hypothetical protein
MKKKTQVSKEEFKSLRETIEISMGAIERLYDEVLSLSDDRVKMLERIRVLKEKLERLEVNDGEKEDDDN